MAGTSLTADGLLATNTSDMTCDTDDPSKAEELLMEREWETDLLSDSEQQITSAQAPTTEKTMPKKGRESNSHNQARGTKQLRDDKRERQGNIKPNKFHQNAEHASIKEKNEKSKNSIGLLQAHLEKGTCPKSLTYNVKVNSMPNEDFKSDVS